MHPLYYTTFNTRCKWVSHRCVRGAPRCYYISYSRLFNNCKWFYYYRL